ncbi:hypothetical protein D3C76_1274380 [compost metagenome]
MRSATNTSGAIRVTHSLAATPATRRFWLSRFTSGIIPAVSNGFVFVPLSAITRCTTVYPFVRPSLMVARIPRTRSGLRRTKPSTTRTIWTSTTSSSMWFRAGNISSCFRQRTGITMDRPITTSTRRTTTQVLRSVFAPITRRARTCWPCIRRIRLRRSRVTGRQVVTTSPA